MGEETIMQIRTLRNSLVALGALALLLVGCGAETGSEPAAQPAALSTLGPAPTAPTDDDPSGGGGGSTDPTALGKQCWVDCSVKQWDPMVSCPVRVNGYGKTTFLGGCGKACTHAEGDAASKLTAGCSLDNCTRRGC